MLRDSFAKPDLCQGQVDLAFAKEPELGAAPRLFPGHAQILLAATTKVLAQALACGQVSPGGREESFR